MSNELIIKQCAPTLAGLKVANLFSYKFTCKNQLLNDLENLNSILNQKDVYLTLLRYNSEKCALILMYRKNKLEQILSNEKVTNFLKNYGYYDFSIEKCLYLLSKHLEEDEFPHEIGVFLGYPLEDIVGFIHNKGKNYKIVGYWKVYSDEEEASKIFTIYKKCTRVYCEVYSKGIDINKLTVAS